MKINKLTVGATTAILIGIFAAAASLYRPSTPAETGATTGSPAGAPAPSSTPLVRPHSPALGPDQAQVTLVEFLDPECESCRAMYPIVKQVMSEFDGRVRLVIRYMPLHGNAVYASSILEAAGAQGKYWEMLEAMMARQPEWASHAAPRPEMLLTYAAALGLDVERLKTDASDPAVRIRILQDQTDGQSLGVNGTPTFFINGQQLMRLSYGDLRSAVQSQLR